LFFHGAQRAPDDVAQLDFREKGAAAARNFVRL
jgi:hypothetical protein